MSQETPEPSSAPPPPPPAVEPAPPVIETDAESRARIKIGTQRSGVDVPRATPKIKFVVPQKSQPPERRRPAAEEQPAPRPRVEPETPAEVAEPSAPAAAAPPVGSAESAPPDSISLREYTSTSLPTKPNLRAELSPDLQLEVAAALGDMSLDDLIGGTKSAAAPQVLEPEQKVQGKVIGLSRDVVFVDLGVAHQGSLALKHFEKPPEPGQTLDVMVARFDSEEGMYDLTLPHGAVDAGDWSTVRQGLIVEARITGHNKGGLECTVGSLRGFMPISQISLYRVENIEQFVGQTLAAVITEANPDKRNLVLSRRAVLEREQQEAREKTLAELAPGQIREGIVRNLRDFGAFVDLGGVDGLLPIGQLAWDRVKHPSDVLTLGQKVRVKIEKIDPDTRKISLSYRDLFESPWVKVPEKYIQGSAVQGTVSKIMDFGAFVKLEPGVEGLVHISEIAHGRVFRVSDFLREGQQVECKILSINPEAQKISLSIKALMARPVPVQKEPEPEPEPETPPPAPFKSKTPLKGGLGKSSGGAKYGLNW